MNIDTRAANEFFSKMREKYGERKMEFAINTFNSKALVSNAAEHDAKLGLALDLHMKQIMGDLFVCNKFTEKDTKNIFDCVKEIVVFFDNLENTHERGDELATAVIARAMRKDGQNG